MFYIISFSLSLSLSLSLSNNEILPSAAHTEKLEMFCYVVMQYIYSFCGGRYVNSREGERYGEKERGMEIERGRG